MTISPELLPAGFVDKGPAVEVSTTERVSIRISTNQHGVKTVWLTGEDGKEYGCTPAGHEQETAHWLIQRSLDSSRADIPEWVIRAAAKEAAKQ